MGKPQVLPGLPAILGRVPVFKGKFIVGLYFGRRGLLRLGQDQAHHKTRILAPGLRREIVAVIAEVAKLLDKSGQRMLEIRQLPAIGRQALKLRRSRDGRTPGGWPDPKMRGELPGDSSGHWGHNPLVRRIPAVRLKWAKSTSMEAS